MVKMLVTLFQATRIFFVIAKQQRFFYSIYPSHSIQSNISLVSSILLVSVIAPPILQINKQKMFVFLALTYHFISFWRSLLNKKFNLLYFHCTHETSDTRFFRKQSKIRTAISLLPTVSGMKGNKIMFSQVMDFSHYFELSQSLLNEWIF